LLLLKAACSGGVPANGVKVSELLPRELQVVHFKSCFFPTKRTNVSWALSLDPLLRVVVKS